MNFEPLLCKPTAWISVCDRLAVHLFEGRVELADMDDMQRVGERWNAKHPGKRVELAVVFPSDTRMTSEERTRMGQLIKQGEVHRAASATVILAEGLRASLHRSMLTGLMLLAPAPHPAKVFGNLPDALTWLMPQLQAVTGSAVAHDALSGALQTHVSQFRARLDRPTASTR